MQRGGLVHGAAIGIGARLEQRLRNVQTDREKENANKRVREKENANKRVREKENANKRVREMRNKNNKKKTCSRARPLLSATRYAEETRKTTQEQAKLTVHCGQPHAAEWYRCDRPRWATRRAAETSSPAAHRAASYTKGPLRVKFMSWVLCAFYHVESFLGILSTCNLKQAANVSKRL